MMQVVDKWNASLWKSYTFDNMAADDLVVQGARASTAMGVS